MFRITDGKGFQITFENGWTVSVQFGPGNYISNRDLNSFSAKSYSEKNREFGERGSPDAEIAAWDKNGEWMRFFENNDSVKGWVSADEVAAFIQMVANK
jgi:hypothetical protein